MIYCDFYTSVFYEILNFRAKNYHNSIIFNFFYSILKQNHFLTRKFKIFHVIFALKNSKLSLKIQIQKSSIFWTKYGIFEQCDST